ncbi:MAG: hypothetical protein GVY10_00435 [Verrucomicrobia bacterium]|jgi:hypothetical protein|nr:hypothetical protein [Verrucomicrobiota bacterium]
MNRTLPHSPRGWKAGIAAFLTSASLIAQPLAYDGFGDYANNFPEAAGPGLEGSILAEWRVNNAGLINVVDSGGLTYGLLPTEEGYLVPSGGGVNQVIDFDTSPDGPLAAYIDENGQIGADGTTLYVSFLYAVDPDSEQTWLQFNDSSTETDGEDADELPDPGSGRSFGVRQNWQSNIIQFWKPGNKPELAPLDGATNLVVMKFEFQSGDDQVTIWSNPEVSTDEAANASVAMVESLNATFDGFYLKSQDLDGRIDIAKLDEIRFADNWSDAVGGVPDFPPPLPTTVSARPISGEAVQINWMDTGIAETAYKVEQAESASGPWTEVADLAADVTSYIQSGLSEETEYFFRVRASNENGDSDPSPVVSATTFGQGETLPAAPTDLDGRMEELRPRLSWTDNATDENRYRIYRSLGGGPFELIGEIDDDSTRFQDTSAPVGQSLEYRIVSVNAFGESLAEESILIDPIEEPSSGSNWVWVEAEDYDSTTWNEGSTWLEVSNDDEAEAASGGEIFGRIHDVEDWSDTDYINTYTFTAPEDGTYNLYIRKLWSYGPFVWRIDDGDWMPAATHNLSILEEAPYRQFFPLVWQQAEQAVELTGGQEHTFEIRVNTLNGFPDAGESARKNYGYDAFLFTTVPFSPAGSSKPGVKTAKAAEGFWAFEPDADTYEMASDIDLSHLNEDMAGESGWVTRVGDDYYLGNGEKVRFVGVTGGAGSYSANQAQAQFLAKRGVNVLRWHTSIDDRSEDSDSINNVNDLKILEAQATARAMAESGIYTNLSPFFILGFRVREQWNIPGYDAEFINNNDRAPFGIFLWNETFKDAYKAWMTELLTRPNPFHPEETPLAEDPAVMNFEILNEDNVFFFTFAPNSYPDEQREKLEGVYGDWIIEKYGSIQNAYDAWGGGSAIKTTDDVDNGRLTLDAIPTLRGIRNPDNPNPRRLRQRDQLDFLIQLQRDFWDEMVQFVRGLGYQGPVSPTNWKTANDARFRDAEYYTYTATDVIDVHNYFAAEANKEVFFAIREGDTYANHSAVDRPEEISTALKQVEDRVTMLSEFVWVNPSDVAAENALIANAYASMQDLDSIFYFSHSTVGFDTTLDVWQPGQPVIMGQFPGANLLYRRGDFEEAPLSVREGRTYESMLGMEDSIIVQGSGFDPTRDELFDPVAGTGSLGMEAALVGKVELAFDTDVDFVHPDLATLQDEENGLITSATGEIQLDQNRGIFIFNSERSQGATSYLGDAGEISLDDTVIQLNNTFGAVLVISLDGKPIADSNKVLIQAASRNEPYQFQTSDAVLPGFDQAYTIENTGLVPFTVEDIDGMVKLLGYSGASAEYLDANGYPVAAPVHYDEGDDLVVELPFNAFYTVVTRTDGEDNAPYVYSNELQSVIKGKAYTDRLEGFSPHGDLTWSLHSGALPSGLTISDDGTVSGSTDEDGVFAFNVSAHDGNSSTTAEVRVRVINVDPPVVSLWNDTEPGDKETGIGWINDTAYPFIYHYNAGSYMYVFDGFSSLESIYLFDYASGDFYWTSDAYGGWHASLTSGNWNDWTP